METSQNPYSKPSFRIENYKKNVYENLFENRINKLFDLNIENKFSFN